MNGVKQHIYEGFRIRSPKMIKVYQEIEGFARNGLNCILYGPTGSGKEFLARYYYEVFKAHHANAGPLVSLNCPGLTNETANSKLFGHMKGSFTDALFERDGIFITATNGVLFLDEIGELSLELQTLLLRAIDPGEAEKMGSDKTYKTNNVVIIGATDKSPHELKPQLLYRMGPTIYVPGLDERRDDIREAVIYFVKQAYLERIDLTDKLNVIYPDEKQLRSKNERERQAENLYRKISDELINLAEGLKWPGNFRSLNNVTRIAIFLTKLKTEKDYIREIKNHFIYYADIEQGVYNIDKQPEIIDPDILHAIETQFSRWSQVDKKQWARVLSLIGENSFLRCDIEKEFAMKPRTLQNRLKELVEAGIISSSGKKGDVYRVDVTIPVSTPEAIIEQTIEPKSPLGLPPTDIDPAERKSEIDEILEIIKSETHVFISGESKSGKTTVALLVGKAMQAKIKDVLYYALNEEGMHGYLEVVRNFLKHEGMADVDELQSDQPL